MRVGLLTDEWPPHLHGGAGVHAVELAGALRRAGVEVDVHSTADAGASGVGRLVEDLVEGVPAARALRATALGATTAAAVAARQPWPDVIHSHTWPANGGGHLTGLVTGRPHVVTAHSLEPPRPWKRQALGAEYAVSAWIERTSFAGAARIIAVSDAVRAEIAAVYPEIDPGVVRVVRNGVDTGSWFRDDGTEHLGRLRIRPDVPTVVFLGRGTRQKGLPYFVDAAVRLPAEVQIVVCVGSSPTPERAAARERAGRAREAGRPVVWVDGLYERAALRQVLSHATAMVCPSMYEPLGIVNLESLACGTPVIASRVGGIPEVVVDGETGWLAPVDVDPVAGRPRDEERFVAALHDLMLAAVRDPGEARERGRRGRAHVERHFGWADVAARTVEVYREAVGPAG